MCLQAIAVRVLNLKRSEFRPNQLRLLNTTEAPNLMECADHCDIHSGNNVSVIERCHGVTYDKDSKECLLRNFEPWVLPAGDLESVWHLRTLLRK